MVLSNFSGTKIRKTLLFIFISGFVNLVFAIPGIKTLLPTLSGQYVYYRDNSFINETYIGFLQYDESTISIRYYTPEPEKGLSEIILYISLNPNSDCIDMIGEKIDSHVSQDDTDIMNYMHDLLYELSARRKKANPQDFTKLVTVTENYPQFGGNVTMNYYFYIPLFNLAYITAEDGSKPLELITSGKLINSEDFSFSNFTGIPDLTVSKKRDSIGKWKQEMDNLWMMDSKALIMKDTLDFSQSLINNNSYTIMQNFAAQFITSLSSSYVLAPNTILTLVDNELFVDTTVYNEEESSFSKDIKILIREENNTYRFLEITVLYPFYQSNTLYFTNFIKQFRKNISFSFE